MNFVREINRLLIGVLLLFVVVAGAATYWAVVGPDTILERADNPRLVEAEAEIVRGEILDRNQTVLVSSKRNANLAGVRQYLYPEMYSALGYSSLRYGVSGAEAASNTILRGDDLQPEFGDQFLHDLLHLPRQGSDVRLTFDRTIQQVIVKAIGDHIGAVVVLSVPSGEVLALVSLPTYDPNTLDANWEQLTKTSGNPFFNRVLQGAYQPGGTLETPLIAAALLANYPLDTISSDAARPVQVGKVELSCVHVPKQNSLTLREAYASSCPYPFAELMSKLGLGTIEAIFNTFQLNHPPTLSGYTVAPTDQPTPTPQVVNLSGSSLLEDALGQGNLTVTPLEMAVIAAAVVNDGSAPTPFTLLDYRRPNSETWIPNPDTHVSVPLMTANTARQLQDVMRLSVQEGAAQRAAHPNIDIGGHATRAFSGNEIQSWFVGFATWGGRQGIAIAVVIENSADAGLAAEIGGKTLASAYERLR